MKKKILISILGTVLDQGFGAKRWDKWRPTLGLFQQDDFIFDEIFLIYEPESARLIDQVTTDIRELKAKTKIHPTPIQFKDPWDFEEVFGKLLDFSESLNTDPDKNDYFVHITTGTHVAQICLFLLTESRFFPGKLVQTSPRQDGKHSNTGSITVIDLDLSRYDSLANRFGAFRHDDLTFLKSGIITRNKGFNQLIERIEKVASRSRDPILLIGPTGAGKSQLAKKIFELKKVKHEIKGSFMEINCATLKGENAMAALFGHRKGSFTGAVADRPGLLKTADGGILFLDEISELGLDEQAMLLRAVEEKIFLAVGADKEIKSDFQLICGTNRDLFILASQGLFREDLLARINLWTFMMPGLKDRPEDIKPNIEYELSQFSAKNRINASFNSTAFERFLSWAITPSALWIGNFRDLNGALTRMCTLADGGRITTDVVDDEITRLTDRWQALSQDKTASATFSLCQKYLGAQEFQKLDNFELPTLEYVLSVCTHSRNLAEAGKIIFNKSREARSSLNDTDRIKKYLAKYKIEWENIRTGTPVV